MSEPWYERLWRWLAALWGRLKDWAREHHRDLAAGGRRRADKIAPFIVVMLLLILLGLGILLFESADQQGQLYDGQIASCESGNDSRLRDQTRLEQGIDEAEGFALQERDPEVAAMWRAVKRHRTGQLRRLVSDVAAGGYQVAPGSVERDCAAFVEQSNH